MLNRKNQGRWFSFWGVFGIIIGLHSGDANAFLHAVAGGISYPSPAGTPAQTLNSSLGFMAETWTDSPILKNLTVMHFSLGYQPFGVRNQVNISNSYFNIFAGLRIQGANYGNGFAPFMGADLGMAISSLNINNTVSSVGVTGNSSSNLAFQYVPGFDLPITHKLGVMFQTPIRFIFSRTGLTIFDAVFSVRYSL